MRGGVTYRDLTVLDRVSRGTVSCAGASCSVLRRSDGYWQVKILDALCQWKLDTCGEIQKHIALLLKDNDDEAITSLVSLWERRTRGDVLFCDVIERLCG